jgi:hypothetical protein
VAVVYLMLARIPPDGVELFERYEANVLPLLDEYGGQLERRLRSADRRTEAHLVSFPTRDHFAAYRDDPRRAAQQQLLRDSGAEQELHELHEV